MKAAAGRRRRRAPGPVPGVVVIFEGNDAGDEPTEVASAPDGVTCVVSDATVG